MRARAAGFTLLPVVLAITLVAAVAFLLNRSNALSADVVAGRSDREVARFAAEAGLQAANFVIQQAGCGGTYPVAASPLVNANFGGAAYSAHASAATGSPLTLTSTGTYNGASVTLTRPGVYVYQPGVKTFVHQPTPGTGIDTWIDSAQPARNNGNDEGLYIDSSGQQALLKFDLSFLPAGVRVVTQVAGNGTVTHGAVLELFKTGSGSGSPSAYIDAHLVPRAPWTEGSGAPGSGVTWTTYDGVNAWPSSRIDSRAISSTQYQNNSGWQTLEITDAVRAWMTPAYPNLGVLLRASPSGASINNLQYYSSDTMSTQNRRPKLTLNYLLPCGAAAPSPPSGVTLTLNPIADSYMSSAAPAASFGNATTLSAFDSGGDVRRALLKFDLSSIPPGQALQSATLRLQSTGVTNASTSSKTVSAYAVNEAWTEGTTSSPGNAMSWLLRDGLAPWVLQYRPLGAVLAVEESTGASPPPPAFATGALSWNVRGIAQEWVDGLAPNHGIVLISTVRDNFAFGSREAVASSRPQLVITY